MQKVSVSVREDHLNTLDEYAEAEGAGSRSAALREILDEYAELQTEYDELHTECERLRTRLDDREARVRELEEQLAQRSQVEEKIEHLPDKIRDVQTYQERRQRLLDEASLGQRIKWKVTGVPVEEIE